MMAHYILILSLMLFVVASLFCVTDALKDCISLHNGCSSRGLFETYKPLFTPACNEHDVCYFCGHQNNITKNECDDRFYSDMVKLCDENGGWGCWPNAVIYFSATRLFGAPFYTKYFFPICEKPCVKEMLLSHSHE